MKQIRYILLAGTIIASGTAMAFAGAPADAPLILAQAAPEAPAEEVPPQQRKPRPDAPQRGEGQPRGERPQRAGEQPRTERPQRQQEQPPRAQPAPRPAAPADAPPPRAPRQEAPPRAERPPQPARPQPATPPRAEQPPRPDAPPRAERRPQPDTPPAPRRAAPPSPAEPPARPAATPDTPPPPRAEQEPPRQQRRDAPPPAAGTPPIPQDAAPRRAPETPRPPVPPVPPTAGDAPPPAERAPAAEAPSILPAPPPPGETPAVPPEELSGRRTPEQQRRAERRIEEEFRNRDRRFDEKFDRRIEEESGNRTIIREGDDRIIIREGDRTIIRTDETERLRRNARDVRTERGRNDENVTVIRRPDGSEVVTVTDRDGNLIRRFRRENGREIVIIDNRRAWERQGRWDRERGWRDRDRRGPFIDFYLDLPPVHVGIPREEYIIDADRASYDDYYEALEAPPLVATERPYSLQEVTQNVRLRERVRSIDLNTINFATGEWTVADDQIDKLEDLARAMKAVIDRNPNEVYLIEGHTDAVGSALDNLSLSDRRAEEVAAILTEYYQIPAENLVTQGYGEDYLKVNTQAANAENRRVTIRNITALLNAQAQ